MSESYQDRIRRIVERAIVKTVCPLCGFKQFTGSVHPYAGIRKKNRDQMKWCTGKTTIQPKEDPGTLYVFNCEQCKVEFELDLNQLMAAEATGLCPLCSSQKGDSHV